MVKAVVVVSFVLSPKFQAKYEALPEQEASKVTTESIFIVFCEQVKHDSVGLEQEIVQRVITMNNINGAIALFILVAKIIVRLFHIPRNNKTVQCLF